MDFIERNQHQKKAYCQLLLSFLKILVYVRNNGYLDRFASILEEKSFHFGQNNYIIFMDFVAFGEEDRVVNNNFVFLEKDSAVGKRR